MNTEAGVDGEVAVINRRLQQAAAGDLTVRLETDREDEMLADLSGSVNEMLAELDGTLLGIQSFGVEVATETQQVSTGVEEIQQTSTEVGQSIEEIAAGAHRQTTKLSTAGDELTDLSATIEEIASSADEVATLSEEAASHATEGTDLAEASMATMGEIQSQADTTVDRIGHLESEMDEITDIVDLIDDIADQTNILALNASIEAARAGEAGDGFAVVANEVKSLAEETQDATTDIAQRVDGIQETTTDAASDIREMRTTIEEGLETIADGLEALETIADRVNEANDGVQSISDATDEQAESTQEMVGMIDEVISVSEQTSAEAETVSAAAEQQTAALTQIADSVSQLDDLVVDLSSQLDNFTVGEGEDHVALTNPDYEAAVSAIEDTNEELLELSDAVVTAYTSLASSSEYPDEINIAGRQRMLSQRIAKQTLVIARNERAGDISEEISEAKDDLTSDIEEFQHALDTLENGGNHRDVTLAPAPEAVREPLGEVRSVWKPLRRNAETVVRESKFTADVQASVETTAQF
ncbi:methyl-accepting chemotaxis protein [Halohasta litchfieldiae]|jgi:methyl-accepting chemotaxis protein|uniref:Methyl-accepting chemotaxis protein n=1 Tax=Halohasta litchfieldiae TaxID=1073996 RepID=A0A1H6RDS1_9EURY|nr:methyl-accepting chemotaxis protein [Halohasta litchfieldiae]ATW89702.1 methyl-accepting chemotaxis protein [Halohasta litchfieldiae]SEI53998.1 Methyl-accepting chemotaxis protein [Halohasta litchfieldiae]